MKKHCKWVNLKRINSIENITNFLARYKMFSVSNCVITFFSPETGFDLTAAVHIAFILHRKRQISQVIQANPRIVWRNQDLQRKRFQTVCQVRVTSGHQIVSLWVEYWLLFINCILEKNKSVTLLILIITKLFLLMNTWTSHLVFSGKRLDTCDFAAHAVPASCGANMDLCVILKALRRTEWKKR